MQRLGKLGLSFLLGLAVQTSWAQVEVCSSSEDCNDANPCTTDTCEDEVCFHEEQLCDDDDLCTVDSCDGTGCFFEPIPCDDGNPNTADFCVNGVCFSENAGCDDDNPCTMDSCASPNCNTCVHEPINCDDGNSCTEDSCNPNSGACVHEGECGALLDIKPGLCPNPVNVQKRNYVIVALVGTASFNPNQVDYSSLRLVRADEVGSPVAPIASTVVLQDLATPLFDEPCACHALGGDGKLDLRMKFYTEDVVAAFFLEAFSPGTTVQLTLQANLLDGTPIAASDCIEVIGTH